MTSNSTALDGAETTVIPMASASNREFDLVLRGYDRGQVDHHIDVLQALLTASEQATEQARAQAARLAEEAAQLRRNQPADGGAAGFAGLGRRVERILSLAEEQAAETRARAEREVAEARAEAARARTEVQVSRQEVLREAEQAASRLQASAQERAEAVLGAAREEAERIVAAGRQELARLAEQRDAIRAELAGLRRRLSDLTGD